LLAQLAGARLEFEIAEAVGLAGLIGRGSQIAHALPFEGACEADGRLCYDTLHQVNADGTGHQLFRSSGSHPSWTASTEPLRPIAQFQYACGESNCSFNGIPSWHPNGIIVSHAWDFGDGATGSGSQAEHTYAASGTYAVTLTVTDDDGLTGTRFRPVTIFIPPPPVPPMAAFNVGYAELQCGFNGWGSLDPDGYIIGYAWAFGDGSTGWGPTVVHTYAAAGTYTATLTVTDDDGLTDTVSHVVTVAFTRSHVGALDGAATQRSGSWTASVTAIVHDSGEGRVANAAVNGTWTIRGSGSPGSCTTNGAGECTVSRASIPNGVRDVSFAVDTVAHTALTYTAGESHDPDGDSNGRVIVVRRNP
jgi:PKD repeat protein